MKMLVGHATKKFSIDGQGFITSTFTRSMNLRDILDAEFSDLPIFPIFIYTFLNRNDTGS